MEDADLLRGPWPSAPRARGPVATAGDSSGSEEDAVPAVGNGYDEWREGSAEELHVQMSFPGSNVDAEESPPEPEADEVDFPNAPSADAGAPRAQDQRRRSELTQLLTQLDYARMHLAQERKAREGPDGASGEAGEEIYGRLAAAADMVEAAQKQVAQMLHDDAVVRERKRRPWMRRVFATARSLGQDLQQANAELEWRTAFETGFPKLKARKLNAVQVRVPDDAKPGDVVPVPLPDLDFHLPLTIPEGAAPGDVLQVMLGSEEDDDRELPPSRGVGASLKIAIPSDAHPGDRLTITTPSNQTVDVRVPEGSSPGEVMVVRVPGMEDPVLPLRLQEHDLGLRTAGLPREHRHTLGRALRKARAARGATIGSKLFRARQWLRARRARREAASQDSEQWGEALDPEQLAAVEAVRVRSVLGDVDRALRFVGAPASEDLTAALRTAGIRSPEEVLANFAKALGEHDLELPEKNVQALFEMLKETGLEMSDELLELLAAAFFVEMEIGPGLSVGLAAAEAVQDVLPPSQRLVLSAVEEGD
jgi:hypothetical protein